LIFVPFFFFYLKRHIAKDSIILCLNKKTEFNDYVNVLNSRIIAECY